MVDRDRRAYDPAMTARLRAAVPGSVRRAVWQAISPALRGISSVKGTTTEEPVVALTFDDGPDPETTPAVLELLARAGARATFFMLVDRAEAHPELVSETVGAGHEVGLHGLDHTRLTTLPPTEVYRRLRDGRDRLSRLVGAPIRLFRAPHGAQRVATVAAARAVRRPAAALQPRGRRRRGVDALERVRAQQRHGVDAAAQRSGSTWGVVAGLSGSAQNSSMSPRLSSHSRSAGRWVSHTARQVRIGP